MRNRSSQAGKCRRAPPPASVCPAVGLGVAAIHEVELGLWRQLLALGLQLLGQFVALQGTGDVGETVPARGPSPQRLPQLHGRGYTSIFGKLTLQRTVYGSREGQKIEFVPLDNRLQLPESNFSHVLQDWDSRVVHRASLRPGEPHAGEDPRPGNNWSIVWTDEGRWPGRWRLFAKSAPACCRGGANRRRERRWQGRGHAASRPTRFLGAHLHQGRQGQSQGDGHFKRGLYG